MIVLILAVFCLYAFYVYATRSHKYWANKNVKHDRPLPLFGNHLWNLLAFESITEIAAKLYRKYPEEKVVGYYRCNTPEIIIRDLDIVRQIMTVDFSHHYPRGIGRDPNMEPLYKNLFHADGDTWRLLRQRLTPAFTTAKLKAMFPLVARCAESLQATYGAGGEYDAREMMARFTTEFIGACGFGIEMNTINNEKSQFRELGRKMFTRNVKNRILFPLTEMFPELGKKIYVGERFIEDSITVIVKKIREQRQYKPSGRHDFVDLLLELEANGKIVGESIEKRNPDGSTIQVEMAMDLSLMVAQVFVFFAAGFETSSSATSYTLHELAFNPEVQEKVQKNVDEVLQKYDNKLCYDAVAEMTYLEMAFKEGMRKFPSLGCLHRVCARKYEIPGVGVKIDPGVKIIIPVQAIHMDEQYFDNPEEFRPERFTPEASKDRHKYSYLPFGEGPRACIGAKLGLMQSLAGLAAILHKFSVEPSSNTMRKAEVNHTMNVVQSIKGGLPLMFTLRKKD